MWDVFISYSHKDSDYAHRLAEELEQKGFSVWIDDRIDYGTRWPDVIEEHLDDCSAFVVIMTPRSKKSDWVQNELGRAKRKRKKIFPLLLEGEEPWLSVEVTQYVDVRGSGLPPERFYRELAKVLGVRVTPPEPVRTPKPRKKETITLVAPKLECEYKEPPTRLLMEVLLEWTAVPGASSYVVEYNTDRSFSFRSRVVYEGDETEYSFSFPIRHIRPTYYRVKAIGVSGVSRDSPWSNVVSSRDLRVNEIENDLELQRVLWACYTYWQGEALSPHERTICYSWVIGPYKNRFDTKFHQSKLSRLAELGFLKKGDTARSGNRRYYKIADPNQVEDLLRKWNLI